VSEVASALVVLLLPLMGLVGYTAIHHLWLWLGRRDETLYLWVAGWSVNTVVFLLARYIMRTADIPELAVLGARLAWVSGIVLVILGIGTSHGLAGQPMSRAVMLTAGVLTVGLLGALWFTDLVITGQTYLRTDLLGHQYVAPVPGPLMAAFVPYLLLVFAYCLVTVWRAEKLERTERRAIVAGFTVYILLALNDVLHAAQVIQSVLVFEYGFVGVAMGLTYLLVRRSNQLYVGLEAEVAARTLELERRQQELKVSASYLEEALGEAEHANRAAERRGQELAALVRAGQVVMAGLDLSTTLQRIIEEASRIAQTPHVKVLLVDEAEGVLRTGSVAGGQVPDGFRVRLGTSYSGVVAVTGRPLFIADTQNDPENLLGQRDRDAGIRTYLGLPIKTRDQVLGVLTFNTESPREYTAEELAYLGSFADQAAIAIQNARLYEVLELRIRRLETLTRLTQVISSSLDRNRVLHEITRAAAELTRAPMVTFWVADESARTLEMAAFSDPAMGADLPLKTLRLDQGVIGWVATHRQKVNVPDVFADPRLVSYAWWRAHGLSTFFGVPVVLEGALVAVLALNGRQPFRLGPDEEALIDSFATQAALAIKNASLFAAEGEARRAAELALAQIRQLHGLLPICAYCKRIRNDQNYWEQLENYIGERSQATFSHGVCPECREKIVQPELEKWRQKQRRQGS
jgi:GAF domain-containing protein